MDRHGRAHSEAILDPFPRNRENAEFPLFSFDEPVRVVAPPNWVEAQALEDLFVGALTADQLSRFIPVMPAASEKCLRDELGHQKYELAAAGMSSIEPIDVLGTRRCLESATGGP